MKIWLSVILVLGVLMLGGGIWVFSHPVDKAYTVVTISGAAATEGSPAVTLSVPLPAGVAAPEGSPVITLGVSHENASTVEYLYIYPNRVVLYIENFAQRSDLDRQGVQVWKNLELSQVDFDSLLEFIVSKSADLKEEYFRGTDYPSQTGDMDAVLTINCQGISKTVKAAGYFSPYSSLYTGTYAGMPSPLAEICQELNRLGSQSVEFYRWVEPGQKNVP